MQACLQWGLMLRLLYYTHVYTHLLHSNRTKRFGDVISVAHRMTSRDL